MSTPAPSYTLLYVRDPAASADFWEARLGRPPVERSATFVLFVLDGGHKLGFWVREGVAPAAAPRAGVPADFELAIAVDGAATVERLHAEWRAAGAPIVQAPTPLDFGHAFVATDPDGYRLRVFAPGGEAAGS